MHPALLLGGPRAILMQVAHPKVAAGVADHSQFASDPFGRLVRTMRTMDRIAFGSAARSARALEGLAARHRRVNGTTAAGEHYSALDPALTLWVHATLVDTALTVDRRYLGLLGRADQDRFYEESLMLAAAFRIPEELVPPDLPSFRAYVDEMTATVEVGRDARSIARHVLRPPLSGRAGGALGLLAAPILEAVTADLLPGRFRREYRLRRAPSLVPGRALPGLIGAATDGAGAVGMALAAAVSRLVAPRVSGLPVSRLAL
jgi:uncharacterized protein (DUF2236 family)